MTASLPFCPESATGLPAASSPTTSGAGDPTGRRAPSGRRVSAQAMANDASSTAWIRDVILCSMPRAFAIVNSCAVLVHVAELEELTAGLQGAHVGAARSTGTVNREPMITRETRPVRSASEHALPPSPRRAGAKPSVTSRIVALLRAERSLALAVFSVVLLKLISDNPEIGEVGHFGFLTEALLVYIFLVVMFTALGVVRHAEMLAEKYGEPYGTLILTVSAVTVEVVMVTAMILHGENDPSLARDTIFATVMVLVNGLVGLSLLLGGLRYGEQRYNVKSSKVFLTMLFALTGLALVLPDTLTPAQEPDLKVFLVPA